MTACFECICASFTDALVAASHHVDCGKDLALHNPRSLTGAVTEDLKASATTRAHHHAQKPPRATTGVCRHDENFPARLARDPDAPPVIWLFGNHESLRDVDALAGFAIIGPRNATDAHRAIASSALSSLSKAPTMLTTTLRLGIDSAAAKSATSTNFKVLAIAAGAPSLAYPRSQERLHHSIAAKHAVISVTPPGAPPPLSTAHAENRLQLRLIKALLTIDVPEHPPTGSRLAFTLAAAANRQIAPTRLSLRWAPPPDDLTRCHTNHSGP